MIRKELLLFDNGGEAQLMRKCAGGSPNKYYNFAFKNNIFWLNFNKLLFYLCIQMLFILFIQYVAVASRKRRVSRNELAHKLKEYGYGRVSQEAREQKCPKPHTVEPGLCRVSQEVREQKFKEVGYQPLHIIVASYKRRVSRNSFSQDSHCPCFIRVSQETREQKLPVGNICFHSKESCLVRGVCRNSHCFSKVTLADYISQQGTNDK